MNNNLHFVLSATFSDERHGGSAIWVGSGLGLRRKKTRFGLDQTFVFELRVRIQMFEYDRSADKKL